MSSNQCLIRAKASLSGKTALVTGGSRGIGRAICLQLARNGADVIVVGARDMSSAAILADEIKALGRQSIAYLADVTDPLSVEKLFQDVVDDFGKLDVLVNAAGGGGVSKPLEALSPEEWDRAFSLNARGTFLCCTAAARQMIQQGSGSIVNIAGASAHRSFPRRGAFGPSKAAVISLTSQASLEWARYGIRVNGVSPGPIRDPGTGWEEREPALAREVQLVPLRRAGTTNEVAEATVFLASESASYITGQMLIVDGGSVNTWYVSLEQE